MARVNHAVADSPSNPDKTLTKLQQAFVDNYIIIWGIEEAAIQAGYSQSSARSTGTFLMKKPEILAAIGDALQSRIVRLRIDQDWVIHEWVKLYHLALLDSDRATARHCLEALSKHVQLYNDALININVYESMSDADLQAQIEGTQRALIDQKP